MLALNPRRQHLQHLQHSYPSTLPSPPPSQSSLFDALSQTSFSPSQAEFNEKFLRSYLESVPQFATQSTIDNDQTDPDQYMTGTFEFQSPAIRIQQSTPIPQLHSGYSQSPMLATANSNGLQNWNSYENNEQMDTTQSLHMPVHRTSRTHQRATSSSSIGSNGSQYHTAGHTTSYPYIANSENSPSASSTSNIDSSYTADEASRVFSNHLPTPSHTPTQDTFLNPNFNNYNPHSNMDSNMAAHLSMKQALLDQHAPEDELPNFGHSARHSVSSYGQDSPATPHTTHGDDFEDKFKVPPTGETIPDKVESWFDDYLLFDDDSDLRHNLQKFDRTLSDMALDELYNPTMAAQIPHSAPQSNAKSSLLSPYRNVVTERLQAAHNARSQSPASSVSGGVSPFRQGSPYAASNNSFNSPHMRVGTAAHAREAQKAESDAFALKHHLPQAEDTQPKTISPKDALLDYHEPDEDSKVPLFPDGGASEYEHQYTGGDQYRNATAQSHYDNSSEQGYRRDSWATARFSPNFSTTSGPSPSQSNFTFVPPAIGGNMHGLPYVSQQYRPTSNLPSAPEQTPEFPAHLTSMESSASEAGGPDNGSASGDHLLKPASSTADTGTYTCTYHGCTLRFETPQKLQKHKREGHRQNPNAVSPTSAGSGMTSAALLERSSQAGPHKCERINPTTGKPCNTVFSRPYDLTRHEDTIHNARKQKVRCALCVEEKTFSRNDALTRHMRVVHPEVDFPGKHRKRGGNHD
jgi:hypothetical protein